MRTRNKALIITGIIIFTLGLILFVLGGILSGWDLIAFIKSDTFIWICVLFGVYGLFLAFLLIKGWYDRL